MRRNILVSTILLVLSVPVVQGQSEPVWTQVPTTGFYDYSTVQQPAQSGFGPFSLYYPGPPPSSASDALGCQWNHFAGQATGQFVSGSANSTPPNYPYWYSGTTLLSGGIPRGGSSAVGVVFEDPVRPDTLIKGVSFLGSFSTVADSIGTPIQSVFWESDSCADGDTEYGFFVQGGSPIFYYSYWTNCPAPGDPSGLNCVETTTGQRATPCVGGFAFPQLPASSNGQYYFNAFPYLDSATGTWWFRAEALDGGSTAPFFSCNVNPASQAGTFNCYDRNSQPASPAGTQNNLTLGPNGTTPACTVVPPGNSSTYFNPGWTYGVYGSLFAVIAGGENDNNPLTNLQPFTVTALKAGK
jgi:hypothetical protein